VTTCQNSNLEKILVSQNHATAFYYAGYTPFSTKLSLSKTQNFFYNISTVPEEEFNTLPDSSVISNNFFRNHP
jgi:hypothetical protein